MLDPDEITKYDDQRSLEVRKYDRLLVCNQQFLVTYQMFSLSRIFESVSFNFVGYEQSLFIWSRQL